MICPHCQALTFHVRAGRRGPSLPGRIAICEGCVGLVRVKGDGTLEPAGQPELEAAGFSRQQINRLTSMRMRTLVLKHRHAAEAYPLVTA